MAKKTRTEKFDKLVAFVFAETAFATGAGMESAMNGRKYFLNESARDFWLNGHGKSIPSAIHDKRNDWDVARSIVIPRARDLGIFAAEFALADALSTGVVEVKKTHVLKATKKVREDQRCKPTKPKLGSKPTKSGGGDFCEF